MARGIVIKIEGDGASARQALEMFREQMLQTGETACETGSILENAFERATRALEYVGIYAGIREAGDALKEVVTGSLEYGEAMVQASQKTGLSVESMSVLHYASGLLHADFEGLVTGIGRMGSNLSKAATGNKQLAADFSAIGINAKELVGQTNGAEIAFHKLITAIASTNNVATRNRLAMDLMGRAGIAQVPVLIEIAQHWNDLSREAQAAGMVLDTETAEKLEMVNEQLADMKMRSQGASLQFTEGLAPALRQILVSFTDGAGGMDSFGKAGKALGDILKFLITDIDVLKMVIMSQVDIAAYGAIAMGDYFKAVKDALHGNMAGFYQEGLNVETAFGHMTDAAHQFKSEMADLWGDKATTLLNPPRPGKTPQIADITPGHSQNGIAEAAAALAEEQARAAADAQKDADAVALAQLEAHHKEMIGSEQQYLAEKLKLQTDELSAEIAALQQKEATLEALYQKQHNDKLLKRDKNGNSAEELRTMRELEGVWEQMDAASAKYRETVAASGAEAILAKQTAELANLRAAAELEKQRNDGITAQIALLQKETQLEVQKAAAEGASSDAQAQIRANGQLLEQKLRIADVDRQIQQIEDQFNAQAKVIQDNAEKNPREKLEAERQLNALHQQEVAVLQSLVQQYDALAQTLGGEFKTKAMELHAALAELQTPDQSKEPQFGKTLSEGITKMADTLVSQSIRGKEAFHQMAKEMETDAAELAMKLLMMKLFGNGQQGSGVVGGGGGGADGLLGNIFAKIFSNLPHFAAGGSPDGPSIVGENGPELYTPPAKGGTITPNGVLTKLAESGGGGGRGVNVTTNIVNQSRQPVTAQPSQVSYDSQMKEFVISTVLEDHATGGPIAQSLRGIGGS